MFSERPARGSGQSTPLCDGLTFVMTFNDLQVTLTMGVVLASWGGHQGADVTHKWWSDI